MKNKMKMMLLLTLVAIALTACSCNASLSTSPSPKPTAITATPMPSPSQSASVAPSPSAAASPDVSLSPNPSDASGADAAGALDSAALAAEVEKLSEVDASDVVAHGDAAIVGLSFDAQYQGTLTDRIEEMVAEKITAKESGVTRVAVTADPTLRTQIKTLAEETRGKALTSEQKKQFDELFNKIKPAGTNSSAAD